MTSGMILGNGLSGFAGKSIEDYLKGYVGFTGVHFRVGSKEKVEGPGKFFRRGGVRGIGLLFLPLFVGLISMLYTFFGPKKEVCVSMVFGLRNTCGLERNGGFYSLTSAARHTFWLVVFALFEGEDYLLAVSWFVLVVVGFLGLVIDRNVPFLGRYLLSFAVLLGGWSRVKKSYPVARWLVLGLLLMNFDAYVVLIEFCLPVLDSVPGEVEDRFVFLEAHEHLSLEVPQGSCVMSKNYFVDRIPGEGMTEDERLMALKGDRFLKLLAVRLASERRSVVSMVGTYEQSQSDDVFCRWLKAKGMGDAHGKKTRGSFAEVVWGEVSDLLWESEIPARQVWEAFLVFHRETTDLATGLVEE